MRFFRKTSRDLLLLLQLENGQCSYRKGDTGLCQPVCDLQSQVPKRFACD